MESDPVFEAPPPATPARRPPTAIVEGADDPLATVKEVFPGRLLGFEPAERERAAGAADEPAEHVDAEGDEGDR